MGAVGYIRQSRRADLDVALSRDAQLAAIRRLCDGCDILEDMGRSGKAGGERLRPGYRRLVAGIESGEYTEVYAIALSRFSRSVPELHALMELARSRGVRLVTAKEGTMDPHTATGRMIFNTWANFAEFVRDMAVEAANENVAVRRSRGDTMGRRPYGDRPDEHVAVVLDAFREAGSYNGAAVILNAAGVPSHLGRLWRPTSIRLVVARHAPALAPRHPARGRRSVGTFQLAGLLRCPCGGTLTGQTSHEGRYVRYHCHRADGDATHGPKSVGEPVLLEWVRAEVDGIVDRLAAAEGNQVPTVEARKAERDALAAERERLVLLFSKGKIGEADFDRLVEPVDAAAAAHADTETVVDLPAMDWDWPAGDVNGLLRRLIEYVELGPDLRPVRVHPLGSIAEWAE